MNKDKIIGSLRNLKAVRDEIGYGKGSTKRERKTIVKKLDIIINEMVENI